ncbi:MAG: tetratricopeptide repeat protein [Syntrophomonadaceae bacterium]
MGGLYLETGRLPEAEAQFRLALAHFETIAFADPRSVDGRLGVALSRHNLGTVERRTGRRDAALRDFDAARRIYEPIVEADPQNAWAAGMLADCYLELAEAQAAGAPGGDACRSYRLADARYSALQAAGRLIDRKENNAARARRAAAACPSH